MALFFADNIRLAKNNIPDADPLRNVRPLAARALVRAPISCQVDDLPDVDTTMLTVYLGADEANFVNGELKKQNGRNIAEISHFYVALRGYGIGARLLRAFAAEAKDRGAEWLWSDQVSNDALALRSKIFGEHALQFYHYLGVGEDAEVELVPLTLEQARLTNDRIEAHNTYVERSRAFDDPDDTVEQMGVLVDLTEIDASDWERPAEYIDDKLYSIT